MMQSMAKKIPTQYVELSALLVDLGGVAPTEIKLVPAGSFRSCRDNRPTDVPAWIMTGADAAPIVAAQAALSSKFLIDYEHQTLHAKTTGIKAPAAGWSGRLEWREGDGLYAVDMDWNQAALDAIEAKEYRYISPVIRWNSTGHVTGVLMAALTNYPALDNLNDLAAAAALIFSTSPQESAMADDLMERLCYLLNLPLTTTPAEMNAELDKLKAMITKEDGSTTSLSALLTAKDTEIAALSAQVGTADMTPDPAKFVPIEVVKELSGKLAELSGDTLDMQVEKLIDSGIKTGRIIGDSMKAWAIKMGKKNIAELQGFLDNAQPIAALSGMQTAGKAPAAADPSAATTEDAAKQKYQSTAALQAEFGDEATYLAYVAAEASGSVKILGGKN
jgi:phage I-like protein